MQKKTRIGRNDPVPRPSSRDQAHRQPRRERRHQQAARRAARGQPPLVREERVRLLAARGVAARRVGRTWARATATESFRTFCDSPAAPAVISILMRMRSNSLSGAYYYFRPRRVGPLRGARNSKRAPRAGARSVARPATPSTASVMSTRAHAAAIDENLVNILACRRRPEAAHLGSGIFFHSGLSHTDVLIQIGTLEPVPGTRGVWYLIAYWDPAENSERLRTNSFLARFRTHRCGHAYKKTRIQVSPIFCNRDSFAVSSQLINGLYLLINGLYLFGENIFTRNLAVRCTDARRDGRSREVRCDATGGRVGF